MHTKLRYSQLAIAQKQVISSFLQIVGTLPGFHALQPVEVTNSHLLLLSQTASHKTEHNATVPPIDTGFDPGYKRGGPDYRVHPHQTQLLFRSETLE